MFNAIFRFELRRAIKGPANYIYFTLLFAIGFMLMHVLGGAFDGARIQFSGDNTNINSPRIVSRLLTIFSYLGIFIIAAIVSTTVQRDFNHNTLSLTFTTPISKAQYVFGKFAASFLISIVVFLGAPLGIIIGELMPYLSDDYFGEFSFINYLRPFLIQVVPNLFFVSAIFFTLSLLLRNVVVNWFVIIILYVLFAISGRFVSDIDYRELAAILDPFALTAIQVVTSAQTTNEQNTEAISLEGLIFFNRLLWSSVGVLMLILGYIRFKFSYGLKSFKLFGRKKKQQDDKEPNPLGVFKDLSLPKVVQDYSFLSEFKTYLGLLKHELGLLFKNIYFILIVLTGVVLLMVTAGSIGQLFDTSTYPVTYQVIETFFNVFSLFIFIVITLFSGEMIWRERSFKLNEIHNALPVRRWVILMSKMSALSISVFAMLSIMVLCGIIIQYRAGYHQYDLAQYMQTVFGLQSIRFLLLIPLAFFIQVLTNHKYVGYFLMVIYYVWNSFFAQSALQHNLLIYNGGPSYLYSDMNKFGYDLYPYFTFKLYWFVFAIILIIFTNQLMVVGKEDNWKIRFNLLKKRLASSSTKYSMSVVILVFLVIGSFIFYNTNILNTFNRSLTAEKEAVEYEKNYKQYEYKLQPKIIDVYVEAGLFPSSGNLKLDGYYWIKNENEESIDSIHLDISTQNYETLEFNRTFKNVSNDDRLSHQIFLISPALKKGDSVKLSFSYNQSPKGFTNNGIRSIVNQNGTFFNNGLLPSIGYNDGRELTGRRIRNRYNLPEKPSAKKRDDPQGLARNYIRRDADFINFEVIISTSSDQIAMAPGNLQKQWTIDNRNYFHYKMESKILNFFSILSAKYEVRKDVWQPKDTKHQPVDITIYYHKGHEYNLDRMVDAIKQSLDYYTVNYSPYQYNQIRILEFPRDASFAQSFPNTIPFSEGIGFVADLRELEKKDVPFEDLRIDYPFYVTAHEMAHQWWAHQVVSANTEGATLLVETLSQFSALKVMEDYFGTTKMKKFLRQEAFRYKISRGGESVEERPLATVSPGQQYIHYNKGSVILYGLDAYLGDNILPNVLSNFIDKYAFKGAPYPTTVELINDIRAVTPDSLQYLITDGFEKIVLYDYEIIDVQYTRNEDLEYFVEATIESNKYEYDGKGVESKVAMNDYIEIGIYNSKEKELYLEKVLLKSAQNSVKMKLGRKPAQIVINPYYRLLEKDGVIRTKTIEKSN